MIDYHILRKLILESFKANPRTQFREMMRDVERLAAAHNAFPTEEECWGNKADYNNYYKGEKLSPIDKLNVNQIIWDLIVDRILTIGIDTANEEWPFLRLTDFGDTVVSQEIPTYYDPEGYIGILTSVTPELDPVIKQYVLEGLNCFRQRLLFAAAVMFGAAAEKTVLLLLRAIGDAETDERKKSEIMQLIERPRLPTVFESIRSSIKLLIDSKKLPYSIHQGVTEHLLSLFEMIRVHRNDSVHPVVGNVNKMKVLLTIQAMPAALESTYRLIKWFMENQI